MTTFTERTATRFIRLDMVTQWVTAHIDSLVVTVVEPEETTDDGQSAGLELSGLTVVGTTVFVLIAIVGLFAAFAPKRIRKIE